MIRIAKYEARFAKAFAALNREWIEAFFELEEEDLRVLNDPEGYVTQQGGEIFFALDSDAPDAQPIGCVAMVRCDDTLFELAKMAVAPSAQGRGVSRLLMDACTRFAREQGASEIFLVTNDILKPALGLYLKSGFERMPQIEDQRYARGNTEMRLKL